MEAINHEQLRYRYGDNRFWEIVPGALVWVTILGAFILSFLAPTAAIILIILFDVYWLFRVLYFVVYLFLAWRAYRRAIRIDWKQRCANIPRAADIVHLIFLPTYQEDIAVLRDMMRSLCAGSFDPKRFIVVLGGEERDRVKFEKNAAQLEREFGRAFLKLYSTTHPKDLPDEIPGKGSNLHWIGNQSAEWLASDFPSINDEDVVVSAFDVDTVVHPQYFSHLTYLYCTVPNPTRSSYQPVVLFSNNIWTAPAPVRIAAFGTTFWLMGELTRSERLWTFSSHSMPWKMLKEVGFWDKGIVSEDSRIFLQAFVHYHGEYRVTPLFLPVSMDTVVGETYLKALWALYKQQRRWAWGVEHLPFMVSAFAKDRMIPFRKKVKFLFNHIEGMFTWATAPFLIFVLGRLPLSVADDYGSALIQTAPFTLETLMQGAMVGVFISGILSLSLLPPRPKTMKWHNSILMIAQWILLPITFIIFGAVPAIDAQTHLMFGRYLGFNVTKKSR